MMDMELSLDCSLQQYCKCVICKYPIGEHDGGCPAGIMEKLQNAKLERSLEFCPRCCRDMVDVNKSDFFECRSCKTQFGSSFIALGYDVEKLERTKIGSHAAVILPEKGNGKFPMDEKIKYWDKICTIEKAKVRRKGKKQ